jgi:drug/metabolite transporter (DMT)-like permease
MAATGVLFTVLNATLKKVAHELEPWVAAFLRYFLGALVMLAPALRLGVRALWPKAPGLQVVRGLFHGCGMLLWFAAVPLVTLAELTAISFTGPIFICLGAVMFLGERMSGARWAAIAVGFAGVLLVVAPGAQGGGHLAGILLMLASAPVFAGSFLVAKVLTRHERSDIVVLWQHLLVALFLAPFAAFLWSAPTPEQWALLIVCGFMGAGGHYCMTRAFRVADISAVQSARFLEMVWATLLGMALFDSLPDAWTIAGGLVILVATLWLARRESRGT